MGMIVSDRLRGSDITRLVLPQLPDPLKEIAARLAGAFGCPVRFQQDESLSDGRLGEAYCADKRPVVYLAGSARDNMAVIAHELLHLLRRAEGHPRVQSRGVDYFVRTCHLLYNTTDEYAFDSCYRALGYGPDRHRALEREFVDYVGRWMIETERHLQFGEKSPEFKHDIECQLALKYARALLFTDGMEAAMEFMSRYDNPRLHTVRDSARRVVAAIRENRDPGNPSLTVDLYTRCLRDILGLQMGSFELIDDRPAGMKQTLVPQLPPSCLSQACDCKGAPPMVDGPAAPPVARPAGDDPLDELIATILSQNTSDVNSGRAFDAPQAALPRRGPRPTTRAACKGDHYWLSYSHEDRKDR